MKRFLIKSAVYILILLVIGNVISFVLLAGLRSSEFYKPYFLKAAISEQEQLDYVILGSSRGLTSINSIQIDSTLNTNGLNLSMDDTDLKSHLLMLRHFFESGYSSRNIILTLDASNFTTTDLTLGNNDYRFAGYHHKKYVTNHYKNYETGLVKPLSMVGFNPLASLSYYNLELALPSLFSILKPDYRNKFDHKGNYSYPNNKKFANNKNTTIQDLQITNPLVSEITTLCKKNKSELVIYIAPYSNSEIKLDETTYKVINHSNKLDKDSTLFYDNIHVNNKGRSKATALFAKEFKELKGI
jgi:hypothetical protein